MLSAATTPPRLFTLVALTGVSVMSLNMILPSLANMASDFGVDYALVSLSIAGYLAVTAVLQIIMGPLSDRYGRRPVLLIGLVIFTGASLACVLATNIWAFLTFRILQGAIISGTALSRAVIRDTVPVRQAASLMGFVSMAMAIALMLGPMLGGVLDELFGWRSNFVVFFVVGVMLLALCWVDLGETNQHPSETFRKQFQSYPELFRSRRFWGYSACVTFSVGGFYVFLAGAPLVGNVLFNLTPSQLGFFMGTITGGFMFGSFLLGRFAKRHSLTTMLIAGRVLTCVGVSAGLLFFIFGYVHVGTVFGSTIFVGVGNGLTLQSANAGAMSVRPELAGSASGLSGALPVAGGALLTTLTGAVLTEENGGAVLLALILATASLSLFAAFYVRWIDQREGFAG